LPPRAFPPARGRFANFLELSQNWPAPVWGGVRRPEKGPEMALFILGPYRGFFGGPGPETGNSAFEGRKSESSRKRPLRPLEMAKALGFGAGVSAKPKEKCPFGPSGPQNLRKLQVFREARAQNRGKKGLFGKPLLEACEGLKLWRMGLSGGNHSRRKNLREVASWSTVTGRGAAPRGGAPRPRWSELGRACGLARHAREQMHRGVRQLGNAYSSPPPTWQVSSALEDAKCEQGCNVRSLLSRHAKGVRARA
jgi:ribosome modulation factor